MNQDQDTIIQKILSDCRSIAVIGFSRSPDKPAHRVPMYMREQGYTIYPVNPNTNRVSDMVVYPDLASIPHPVDLVLIFRPSSEVEPFIQAALQRAREKGDVRAIWLQEGITYPGGKQMVNREGLLYVEDR